MDNDSDSIKEHVPNRYSLVVLAAKRAKQIKEGAPPLIATDSTNALTIALEEISAGKINYIEAPEPSEDEAPQPAPIAAAPAPPTALQMLTESLAEAERAAERMSAEKLEETETGEETDTVDEPAEFAAVGASAAEEE